MIATQAHPLTLSEVRLQALWSLLPEHAYTVVWHETTLSAAETQAVLPPGVLVLKTVTLELGDLQRTRLLWTGAGDYCIARSSLRELAATLGVSRRAVKGATINPRHVDPLTAYGMQPGMVSPFLAPGFSSCLTGIVVQHWPIAWETTMQIAISLSCYESLIIPLSSLRPLLRRYHQLAYPKLHLIELDTTDLLASLQEHIIDPAEQKSKELKSVRNSSGCASRLAHVSC